MKILGVLLCCVAALSVQAQSPKTLSPQVEVNRDEDACKVGIAVDGKEVVAYQHSPDDPLPHYWPLKSPSGKLLTVQYPGHHAHHRSLWITDLIQADGFPAIDFYHCWKNFREPENKESGYRHFIRHHEFGELKAEQNRGVVEAHLRWIASETEPVLDDHRTLRVVALGDGEYLVDLEWELIAAYRKVTFRSDDIHYAWPYVCMHPQFTGVKGGTITNDQGQTGEAGTHGKVAKWIDYSNTVEDETEGLAVFIYPDGEDHRWLTREYGTFGPRRSQKHNGKPFTLDIGESIKGRVGILVHRGDVNAGRVAERYQHYIDGEL